MSVRLNNVVNKENYIWFARIIKEVVQVQLSFDSIQQDFDQLKKLGKYIQKKEREILDFSQPDDTIFSKWMAEYSSATQLLQVASKDRFAKKVKVREELQLVDKGVQTDDKEEDQKTTTDIQVLEPSIIEEEKVVPQLEDKKEEKDQSSGTMKEK